MPTPVKVPGIDVSPELFDAVNLLIVQATAARDAWDPPDTSKSGPYGAIVRCFFSRGLKSLQAIEMLAGHRFGQDAAILSRSLLDLAIRLAWIALKPEQRAEEYFCYGDIKRKEFYDTACAIGEIRNPNPAERKAIVKDFMVAEQRLGGKQWAPDLRKMAAEVDQELGLGCFLENLVRVVYRVLCGLEHTDVLGAGEWILSDADGNLCFDDSPSDAWIPESLSVAVEAFCIILDTWNDTFKVVEATKHLETINAARLSAAIARARYQDLPPMTIEEFRAVVGL